MVCCCGGGGGVCVCECVCLRVCLRVCVGVGVGMVIGSCVIRSSYAAIQILKPAEKKPRFQYGSGGAAAPVAAPTVRALLRQLPWALRDVGEHRWTLRALAHRRATQS